MSASTVMKLLVVSLLVMCDVETTAAESLWARLCFAVDTSSLISSLVTVRYQALSKLLVVNWLIVFSVVLIAVLLPVAVSSVFCGGGGWNRCCCSDALCCV